MLVQNGNFRTSILIETITTGQTLFNGNTIYGTLINVLDLKNPFSGITFSYTGITELQFAAMSDVQYQTRRNDFLTLLNTATQAQKLQLVSSSSGFDPVTCPIFAPPTTTTTTTSTTTTTTTTTGAPVIFYSFKHGAGIILKTINGGITWSNIIIDGISYINDLAIAGSNLFALGVSTTGGSHTVLFKSTDAGSTWSQMTLTANLVTPYNTCDSLFALNDKNILIGTNSILLNKTSYSTNGNTFSNANKPNGMIMNKITYPNNRAFTAGFSFDSINKTIAKTTNYGTSWINITPSNISILNFVLYDINFIDANNGVLIGSNNTSTCIIFKTTDGGNTWSQMIGPIFPTDNSLFPAYSTIYAFNLNNIIVVGHSTNTYTTYISKTSNGGISWSSPQTFAGLNGVSIDFSGANGIIVGNTGGINTGINLYSTDFGVTWTLITNQSAIMTTVLSNRSNYF